MSFLLERDTINGASGKAFVTIDGQVKELFGTKKVQKKPGAVTQTGTMTIYYGTPLFLDMVAQYIRQGVMPYFTLQTTNEDPATTVGAQTVAYYSCKLSGTIPLSVLDADADMLTMDISFTYEDFEVLSAFHDPAQTGT